MPYTRNGNGAWLLIACYSSVLVHCRRGVEELIFLLFLANLRNLNPNVLLLSFGSVGDQVEKQLLRYGNIVISVVIFFLYYGVPMLTVETGPERSLGDYQDAGTFFRRLLFPISYVGMGQKISKWGIASSTGMDRDASVGALVVMWSSQSLVGKLFDAVDAYYL